MAVAGLTSLARDGHPSRPFSCSPHPSLPARLRSGGQSTTHVYFFQVKPTIVSYDSQNICTCRHTVPTSSACADGRGTQFSRKIHAWRKKRRGAFMGSSQRVLVRVV